MNHDIPTLLRQLDAGAPQHTDPAMHARIRTQLPLATTTDHAADRAPAPRSTYRLRRGLLVAAAAAAAVATVITVNQPSPAMAALDPADIATWTPAALPLGDPTEARNSCFREYGDGIADNPAATYLLEERRGDLTSMIASYQGNTVFCIAGPDNTGLLNSMSNLDVDITDLPTTGITAAVSGDDLDGPPAQRLHYITGRYAPDVTAVDLQLADGRQLTASMQDGWYAIWWTGDNPTTTTQVTWTVTDGSINAAQFPDLPY